MTSKANNLRTALVGMLLLCVTILFFLVISDFIEALFLAAVLAGLLSPIYRRLLAFLNDRGSLAAAATLLVMVLLIVIPGLFLAVLVGDQAANLASNAGPWVQENVASLKEAPPTLPDWLPFGQEIQNAGEDVLAKVAGLASDTGTFILGTLSAIAQGTASFFLQLFIMLYAMFFFITGGPAMVDAIIRTSTLEPERTKRIIAQAGEVAIATIIGSVVIGAMQGLLGGLGFWAAGVPQPALWGMVMVIGSFVPGVGVAIVWVPTVVYLFTIGTMAEAIGLAAWCAVAVGTVDNVLRPLIVGDRANLSNLMVLVSTLGGLSLFGATGLILGPVIASIFVTTWTMFAETRKP